jgi:uncharacterized protein YcbX
MTAGRLASIQRHPIKSHGRERLDEVTLGEGAAMPWDRRWAVAHDATKVGAVVDGWAPCANFSIGSKAPALMAIEARLDEAEVRVTLTHPERPELSIRPDDAADAARFIDWVRPLCPADRAQPERVVALPERGWTDTDYASVSILNLASAEALAVAMGAELSPRRWRCNFWVEGLEPFVEDGWAVRILTLGGATLEIVEPIVRCKATTANPKTGVIDADTLAGLRQLRGQQVMGVYARVVGGGTMRDGDRLALT